MADKIRINIEADAKGVDAELKRVQAGVERARDGLGRFTKASISAERAGARFTTRVTRGVRAMVSPLNKIFRSLFSIKGLLVGTALFASVGLFGVKAIKAASAFNFEVARTAAVAQASAKDIDRLRQSAKRLGPEYGRSATKVVQAQYALASAGLKVNAIISAQAAVLTLARAQAHDLGKTAEFVASTLSIFSYNADQSTRIVNVYAAAIANSQANMRKLTDSMRYVGPVAKALGYDIEETTAALMSLYNAGMRGEQAGTILRGALSALMNPSKEARTLLKGMNIELRDVFGNMLSLPELIDQFAAAQARSASKTEFLAKVMKIVGTEAGPGFVAMINQGGDALRKYQEQVTGTNAASEQAKAQMDTFGGKVDRLKASWKGLLIEIGSIITQHPKVKRLIDNISDGIKRLISYFQNPANKQAISQFITTFVNKLKSVFNWVMTAGKAVINFFASLFGKLDAVSREYSAAKVGKVYERLAQVQQEAAQLPQKRAEALSKLPGTWGRDVVNRAFDRQQRDLAQRQVLLLQMGYGRLMSYQRQHGPQSLLGRAKQIFSGVKKASKFNPYQEAATFKWGWDLRGITGGRGGAGGGGGGGGGKGGKGGARAAKGGSSIEQLTGGAVKWAEAEIKAVEKAKAFYLKHTQDMTGAAKIMYATRQSLHQAGLYRQRLGEDKYQTLVGTIWTKALTKLKREKTYYNKWASKALLKQLGVYRRHTGEYGAIHAQLTDRMKNDQLSAMEAVQLGWTDTVKSFKTSGEHMHDAAKDTAIAIRDTFADVVKLGLKGQFDGIEDAFEKLGGKILDIWVNALARMVAETAMVQASGLLGLNFNMSGGMSSPYGAVGKGLDLAKLFMARDRATKSRAGMSVFQNLGSKVAKWLGLSSDPSKGVENWETWLTQSKEGTSAYNYLTGEGYTAEQISSPYSYIGYEHAAGIDQITAAGEAGILNSGAWASWADTSAATAYGSSAAAYEGMTAASADWAASEGGYGAGTYLGMAFNAYQALDALGSGDEYALGTAAHYGGTAALRLIPYVGDILASAAGFLDSRQMGKWIEENPGMVFGVGSLLDPLGGFLLDAFLGDGSWASDVVDWFGDLFDWHSGGPIQWPRLHAGSFIGKGLRSDEVPMVGKVGEYMMNDRSVDHYGLGFMDAVNDRRYRPDGRVEMGGGGGTVINVNITIEGDFIGDDEHIDRLAHELEGKMAEFAERRYGD